MWFSKSTATSANMGDRTWAIPEARPPVMSDLASGGTAADLLREMLDGLIARGAIQTDRVEVAFRAVPRHLFLPDVPLDRAYSNDAVVTRSVEGTPTSSSSQPEIMALMLEQLMVPAGATVLEIGTGTGYNAALLAELVGPSGTVVSVDLDAEIVRDARSHLAAAGYDRVQTVVGDGWVGAERHAPFERIEATVGMWDISPHWTNQLRTGGVLVLPLMLGRAFNGSVAFRHAGGGRLLSISLTGAGFMPLRGPHAAPAQLAPSAGSRIDGWWTSLPPDDGAVDLLRDLLTQEPRVEWERSGRMFPWLGDQEDLVLLSNAERRCSAVGLLDRAGPGLALLETTFPTDSDAAHRLLAYGSQAPLTRLADLLPRSAFSSIRIEAVPGGVTATDRVDLALLRPHYTFLFRRNQLAG